MLCGTLRGPYCEGARTLPAEFAFRHVETKSLSQNRLRRGGQAHFAPKTPQNEPVPDGSGIGSKEGGLTAEAVVTDPCMWSADVPHLYEVVVEARQGEQVIAEYRGKIGLRRLAPRRPVEFAPGTG